MKIKSLAISLLAVASSFGQTVKVMSYNIRLDVESDGINRWDNRKAMLSGQVQFYEPDFMGIQEGLPHQVQYLDSVLTIYKYIGVGRDDGNNQGEFSAIFYNEKKYKPIQQSTFWLSQTPDKPGLGWDAACNRVCTYGLFEDLKTKKQVWVFNTHFDHLGNVARVESAKLILKKINELNTKNLPFILTGDFNLEEDSESIKLIASHLNDSKAVANQTFGPDGTFNAFEFNKPVTKRIDYAFTSKSGISVEKYAVLSDSKDCRYPSDHPPVYVETELK
ncbi:endonuclease/exonuclease/phosphatase [Flavobacterium akiainvivens]|uniref:Endonuclease/exonuclease/phosphatase n=1 Tax=Flavobacterium akiainvivens TaxID=1202724 RepID=A0A0M8MG67_9FLAO|nr:endonuclease/exonuclease/phosphatase family protein [Flavobacterium akiainvivens]KOS08204.1 endonuclease/exonuclease/phosphatase [Flavobacterium akiainvivens]SFQ73767.1 Metal-dependent hydrolase, endonuclease/exonuclease/phosphatase family [Flavobacterium akiainvivens]